MTSSSGQIECFKAPHSKAIKRKKFHQEMVKLELIDESYTAPKSTLPTILRKDKISNVLVRPVYDNYVVDLQMMEAALAVVASCIHCDDKLVLFEIPSTGTCASK
ncbi:hypothetical protein LOD99_4733 [Oopsacas minuta]|uniref:Uncharacterized protein n=1 Tax=Oopsacas minuta TaxID=111878 RepID=A0AAV7JSK5_9METZ|nr:hypothetical protein LOD99_4733 [Oopsacas minuta]